MYYDLPKPFLILGNPTAGDVIYFLEPVSDRPEDDTYRVEVWKSILGLAQSFEEHNNSFKLPFEDFFCRHQLKRREKLRKVKQSTRPIYLRVNENDSLAASRLRTLIAQRQKKLSLS